MSIVEHPPARIRIATFLQQQTQTTNQAAGVTEPETSAEHKYWFVYAVAQTGEFDCEQLPPNYLIQMTNPSAEGGQVNTLGICEGLRELCKKHGAILADLVKSETAPDKSNYWFRQDLDRDGKTLHFVVGRKIGLGLCAN
jgi:hypothetical protein